jgi:2-oxoglutarate ferredoxin oxidoreductase subunit delta
MTALSRGTLSIDVDACKGCELCIAVCPPGVLTMSVAENVQGYRYPELAPGCTGCRACQMICPDFVFEVFRFEDGGKIDVSASGDHTA